MEIYEVAMSSESFYELRKGKKEQKNSSSNLIFNFDTDICEDKKYIVKSIIGDVLCKTEAQRAEFNEFYSNIYASFDKKDNSLYDELEQKKANAYKQYENGEISKGKYNRLCKQYLKEYKDAKLLAWFETQVKIKNKADEMGVKVIPCAINIVR